MRRLRRERGGGLACPLDGRGGVQVFVLVSCNGRGWSIYIHLCLYERQLGIDWHQYAWKGCPRTAPSPNYFFFFLACLLLTEGGGGHISARGAPRSSIPASTRCGGAKEPLALSLPTAEPLLVVAGPSTQRHSESRAVYCDRCRRFRPWLGSEQPATTHRFRATHKIGRTSA